MTARPWSISLRGLAVFWVWVMGGGSFFVRLLALHDALAGQQLDRLADGAAPHPELFAQRKLVGQLCARLQRLVQNIMVDLVLYLLGQQLVFQM